VAPGSPNNRVIEFASGTGRILKMLSGAGYSCFGIDLSPEMSSYAHHALSPLSSEVITADMLSAPFKTKSFAAAFNALSSISCLDGIDSVKTHLREASRVLSNRGIYIIDFLLGVPRKSHEQWEIERGQDRYEVRWEVVRVDRSSDKFVEEIEVRKGSNVFQSRSQTTILRRRDFESAASEAGFDVERWLRPFRERPLHDRPTRGRVIAVLKKRA
jgi:ubiquinone/menaquinone biosynthesis C-methylase UbiE